MKKKMLCLTMMLLLLCSQGALAQRDSSLDAYMIGKGVELAELVAHLADNDYVMMFTNMSSPEEEEFIAQIAALPAGQPSGAVVVTMDTDALLSMLEKEADIELPDERAQQYLARRLPTSISGMLNGAAGTTQIMLSSVLSVTEGYLAPAEPFPSAILLLKYDEAPYAVIVAFTAIGEGVISGYASPLYRTMQTDTFFEALREGVQLPVDEQDMQSWDTDSVMAFLGIASTYYDEAALQEMLQ